MQHFLIVGVACTHFIKLVFKIGGEVIANIFTEIIGEECRDQPSLILWDQAVFVLFDIPTVLNRRHDRRIGRRAADAQFFHALDQSGFGIARRRLREMLLWVDRFLFRLLALGQLWQALVIIIDNAVIAAFFVDRDEAFKDHNLTVGTQNNLLIGAGDIYNGPFQTGGGHLAGHGAFVDQIV